WWCDALSRCTYVPGSTLSTTGHRMPWYDRGWADSIRPLEMFPHDLAYTATV
ncbi:unnamed protein product, partial [Schistosoma margrebowiei]